MKALNIAAALVVAAGCVVSSIGAAQDTTKSSRPLLKPLWSIRDDADDLLLERPDAARASGAGGWISDNGKQQLIHVDGAGKLIGSVGRRGSGPGEFQEISWFGIGAGDSIYVWDRLQLRVSVFGPSGKFVRTEALASDGLGSAVVFGRLLDGRWLVVSSHVADDPRHPGLELDSLSVHTFSDLHRPSSVVATFAGRSYAHVKTGAQETMSFDLPFSAMVGLTGCEHGFIMWSGAERIVRAYAPDGKVIREIHLNGPPVVFTAAQRTSALTSYAGQLSPAPAVRAAIQEQFEKFLPNPLSQPPQMRVGRDGVVWVFADQSQPSTSILTSAGNREPMPFLSNMFSPTESESDVVVGRRYDNGNTVMERYLLPKSFERKPGTPNALHPSLGRCETGVIK